MSLFQSRELVADGVQYPYHEYSDHSLTFSETPEWLKLLAERHLLRPIFFSEDYWYLQVGTKFGDVLLKPGDWILRGDDGDIFTCTEQMFQKVFVARPL
jgi:hypothetical protein